MTHLGKPTTTKQSSFYFFSVLMLFVIFLGGSFRGWGQVNITPVRTDVSGFPTWTDVSVAGTIYLQLLVAGASTKTPAMDFDAYTSETLNYKARTYGGANAVENTISISISINNGTDWTLITTVLPASSTMTAQTPIDLSSYSGTQVLVKFSVAGTSNTIGAGIDDIDIKGTVSGSSTPTLTTPTSSSITTTGATLGATITSDGGATITSRGTVWATTASPTTNLLAEGGTAVSAFTHARTSMSANTLYYYRGYAINANGTGYSSDGTFWTLANVPLAPTVNGATSSSLNVTVNVNSNPSITVFAIREAGGQYVQANGSLGASAVWQTAATWGTKTVTGLTASTTYTFDVKARNGAGTETAFSGTTALATLAATSTITLSASTKTGFTYVEGSGSSPEQSFTVSGANLTANISMTAPTNYEISKTSGSGFTSPLTFTHSGGTVNATTVYIRLKTGLSAADYNNEVITASSTGATDKTVTCSGSVTSASVTIFTETMGTAPSTTLIPDHETANAFDNDGFTMSGSGDVRNTTASSGYSGASGLGNVFLTNTVGKDFIICNINTSAYTNLSLSFGLYASSGTTYKPTVEVSTDGSNWTALTVPAGSITWGIKTCTGTIPSTSTLCIRFTQNQTTASFRIDDVQLVGTIASACATPAAQPTSLIYSNILYNSIDGSFTASAGTPAAHGYLVFRNTDNSVPSPVNTTTYTAGSTLGTSTVVSVGESAAFTATGLSSSTTYYFYVFAYQNTSCSGGPLYLATAPLTSSQATPAGPSITLGTITGFGNICVGTTAGPNTFTISGTNLTTADITIAALTGYTYCTTSGGTYTSTLTISGHGGGTYGPTTINVKFTPSSAISYNGNIAVSGAGVSTPENCAVTGTGLAVPTITGTTPGSVCISGTVNLGATASAGTINWYTASSGGTSQGTGTSFTTPSISSTTTYYVDATDAGCTTASRTTVTATVNAISNVASAAASAGNAQATLTWTNPSVCYDEILIVVAPASNTGTPSGNGSDYTGNLNYQSGTALGNGYVVYKGSTSSQIVANLTNGTTYFVKFWTRYGSTWSSGLETTVTPVAGPIVTFTFNNSPYLSPSTVPANATVSDMALSTGTIETNVTTSSGFTDMPYIAETGGWTATDQASAKNFYFTITPAAGYELNITGISFKAYATSAGPSAFSFDIDNGAATYTTNAPDSSLATINQSISGVTGKTSAVTIKIQGWLNGSRSSAGSGVFRLDDVNISGTLTLSASQITVTPTTLSNFSYLVGAGPSANQTYTLSASGLSPASGNIVVTAPSGFEVSTSSGSGYASSINVAYASNALSNTTIYTRLTAGSSAGTYSGNITNAGGGAATKNVAVSGAVIKGEPTNDPTSFNCETGTTITIPLTWTDASAGTLPDGYLIKWSNTSYGAITDPVDGITVADAPGSASGALNVLQGNGEGTATGLSQGTQYYFKIWSYTNTGSNIDYKTGSAATTTCATLDAPCVDVDFETSGDYSAWTKSDVSFPSYSAYDHTPSGAIHALFTPSTDYMYTDLKTNPQTLNFWVRANGTSDAYTFVVETSPDGSTWTQKGSYSANGSNTGDITTIYSEKQITLGLSGNYYIKWKFSSYTSGQVLLDDVILYCNNVTPGISISTPSITAGNVEQNADNHIIYKVAITSTITYAALQGATFDLGGNYTSTTLKTNPFKLWYSATDNFGSASQIGISQAYVPTGDPISFSALNTSIVGAGTGTGYLWLTADIACNTIVDKTISVDAIDNANLTFTSANFNTSGPYSAGGTQTTVLATSVTNITGANATDENTGTSTITWTNPLCFDGLIIVASTSSVTYTPTGDGTSYASGASFTYGSGTELAAGQYLIYNGTTSSQVLTNLVGGTTYYIKIFTRKGSVWSSGIETIATPTAKAEPSDHPTNFTCGSSTSSSITLTWTDATGVIPPDRYLIQWSAVGLGSITNPVDGTTYTVNAASINQGIHTYAVTGLNPQTTYYFKIWSYTNLGAASNYKIDGTILSTSCATLPQACMAEGFTANSLPSGWLESVDNEVTYASGKAQFPLNNGSLSTSVIANPTLLTFTLARTSSTTAKTMYVEVCTTSQTGTYSTVATYTHANTTHDGTTNCTVDLSLYSGESTVYLRFRKASSTTSYWYLDDISVTCGSCEEPTTNPTGLSFTNITNTTVDFSIGTTGNGTKRIVIARPSSAVNFTPVDGTTYISADYDAGADLSNGNKVVYNNTGSSGTISGLASGTTYYFAVYEYKCAPGIENYLTSGTILTGSATTKISPLTELAVVCQTTNTATISWVAPEGSYDGVIIGLGTTMPNDLAGTENESSYSANSQYPLGSTIGTNGKVVYKGNGTSVTVTGLTASTAYEIKAYTFKNSTTWATVFPTASIASLGTPNVSSIATTPADEEVQVTWANPQTGCFDEIMVVAKATSAVTASPSGDGSLYTADPVFTGSGTIFDDGKVVFKGTSNSVTVTGLTNGTSYCFKVFTRSGSTWSTGVYECATPIDGVVEFVPGSIAVVGVCSQIQDCNSGYSNGDDEISIVCFNDITTGMVFDMTDNGFSRCEPGEFGNAEGFLRIRRTGGTVNKGSIITFRLKNLYPYFVGIYPDNEWEIDIRYGSLILNTAGDQIFFMTGGTWNNGTAGDNNATYTGGTVLFGFNTNNEWLPDVCSVSNNASGDGSSQNSGLLPNLDCFSMMPGVATDYIKFNIYLSADPIPHHTQRGWIEAIKDPDNWVKFNNCNEYYNGNSLYPVINNFTASETSIVIDTDAGGEVGVDPGIWTGAGGNTTWFDCSNWDNMIIPDSTTDVNLSSTGVSNDCVVGDPAEYDFTEASCRNLTVELSGYEFYVNNASSKLHIFGDFSNNSTFSHSAGSVVFKGGSEQIISGTTSPEFYNLLINNSSSTGIVLNKEVSVAGTLTLTDGYIIGNDTLIMKAGSSLSGGSDATFAKGPVRKVGNTSFTFPTGQNSSYHPISISAPSAATDHFTAEYFKANPQTTFGTTLGTGINHVSQLEYWMLNRTNGSSAVSVTLAWDTASLVETAYLSDLIVTKWDGAQWIDLGLGSTSGDVNDGTIITNGTVPSFSPITFGSKTAKNPLPVEMMYFSGKYIYSTGYVDLKWATSTEINNSHFIVQKSSDARNFSDIAIVSGFGNSSSVNQYSETDKYPLLGVNYYRLKQVDYNGELKYSQLVAVEANKDSKVYVSGLSSETNNISFTINSTEELPLSVKISDMTGKIIYSRSLNITEDYTKLTIPTSGFVSGLYCLMIYYHDKQITNKFIIK
ncbi:MAG: hypothetical protein A2491_04670 [Bacteroidetes bacterium RIFOXYC12_FULL_35_7]|nr:MAG: hypothetical protein A2491_04670 [Bacteroidetes bacterium RIFOXYC12_FULL_35_7]